MILFAFRPQFRGQSYGAFKFLLNAIYLGSAQPLLTFRERIHPLKALAFLTGVCRAGKEINMTVTKISVLIGSLAVCSILANTNRPKIDNAGPDVAKAVHWSNT